MKNWGLGFFYKIVFFFGFFVNELAARISGRKSYWERGRCLRGAVDNEAKRSILALPAAPDKPPLLHSAALLLPPPRLLRFRHPMITAAVAYVRTNAIAISCVCTCYAWPSQRAQCRCGAWTSFLAGPVVVVAAVAAAAADYDQNFLSRCWRMDTSRPKGQQHPQQQQQPEKQ